MSNQSIQSITFNNSCESSNPCEISIELDEILNNGSTEFETGESVYYRVYPAATYSCYTSNGGSISVVNPNKIVSITEDVTFSGIEANLSHILSGSFSYKWLGSAISKEYPHTKSTPKILAVVGSTAITTKDVYGIASITYSYSYTSIKFMPSKVGKQIVLACRMCGDPAVEVCTYQEVEIQDAVFEDVTLTINDACESGIPVQGAQVTIDGNFIDAISGADGIIHVGLLSKGTHSIVVTAPGYVSSNTDNLSNDQISVGET